MPRLRQNKTYQLNTPAKLNLSLEVVGQRHDGFHELRTVMSTIDLYDTLRLETTRLETTDLQKASRDASEDPSISFRLVSHNQHQPQNQDIPAGEDNLVVRALKLLREEAGTSDTDQQGLIVKLYKRIPSQAGLGGGSSDAAAALVLGNLAWGLGLDVNELSRLSERLGSDIPFFVHTNFSRVKHLQKRSTCKQTTNNLIANTANSNDQKRRFAQPVCRAALCEGRGERITPLNPVGGIPCVVIKPDVGLSTPKVFGAYKQITKEQEYNARDRSPHHQSSDLVAKHLASGDWKNLGEVMGNALQQAAIEVAPVLNKIPKILSKLPVVAHQLSGSGSAYFALCRTSLEARRVAAILRAHAVGRLYVTKTC